MISRAALRSTTVSQAWAATKPAVAIGFEVGEVVAVAGQQRLGHELEQDRVVALEVVNTSVSARSSPKRFSLR